MACNSCTVELFNCVELNELAYVNWKFLIVLFWREITKSWKGRQLVSIVAEMQFVLDLLAKWNPKKDIIRPRISIT